MLVNVKKSIQLFTDFYKLTIIRNAFRPIPRPPTALFVDVECPLWVVAAHVLVECCPYTSALPNMFGVTCFFCGTPFLIASKHPYMDRSPQNHKEAGTILEITFGWHHWHEKPDYFGARKKWTCPRCQRPGEKSCS